MDLPVSARSLFSFKLSGMQFFGGDLQDVEADSDNSIRFNYNSFGKAAGRREPVECGRRPACAVGVCLRVRPSLSGLLYIAVGVDRR